MRKLWTKKVFVPFRKQGGGEYCGAACLQMLLEWAGLPLTSMPPRPQPALFSAMNYWPAPDKFGDIGSPHGVTFTMNRYAPTARQARRFRLETAATPYDACGAIVSALAETESPSIALVLTGSHWVVVTGVQADRDPRKAEYALKALWVQNPDNKSGTSEHLTYAAWLYIYFNGSAAFMPHPFVCVVDSRARAGFAGLPTPEHVSDVGGPKISNADEWAREGLADYGLTNLVKGSPKKPWTLNTSSSNKEGETAYYLVPFVDDSSKTVDIVLVDGFIGTYLGTRFSVSSDVLKRGYDVARNLADLASVEGERAWWDTSDESWRTLVWQSCRESTSPFDFFYRITVGGSPKYVRLDGEVFAELTPR